MATKSRHTRQKSTRRRVLQTKVSDQADRKKGKGASIHRLNTSTASITLNEAEVTSRWSLVGSSESISSDEEIATFLLDLYFSRKQQTGTENYCTQCKGQLRLFCAECQVFAEQGTAHQPLRLTQVEKEGAKSAVHSKATALRNSSRKKSVRSVEGNASSPNCLSDTPGESKTTVSQHIVTSSTDSSSLLKSVPSLTECNGIELPENDDTDACIIDEDNADDDDLCVVSEGGADACQDSDEGVHTATDTLQTSFKTDCDSEGEEAGDSDGEEFVNSGNLGAPVCPLCGEVFKSTQECKTHFRSHGKLISNGEDAYFCRACTKTYPRFSSLYRHMRLSTGQQKCSKCSHVFSSRCEIVRHMRNHAKEKDRFCYQCDKPYPGLTKKDFAAHVKGHFKDHPRQGGSEQGFLCSQCGKIFKKKDDLRNHMTYHNKDSPFVCTYPPCTKAFKNKGCLRQHLLTHKEKNQQCEICGAKFARKCGLRRHMQKHYGKEFGCSECSHKFCSKTELVAHVRTVHLGIRRHLCSLCGAKFCTTTNLLKHTRTHTGEKPFCCEECPSRFAMKHALLRHMRRHTGEKPYQCEDCGQKYACLKSYKLHRKKYHSDNMYRVCADWSLRFKPVWLST